MGRDLSRRQRLFAQFSKSEVVISYDVASCAGAQNPAWLECYADRIVLVGHSNTVRKWPFVLINLKNVLRYRRMRKSTQQFEHQDCWMFITQTVSLMSASRAAGPVKIQARVIGY